jgi:hypothetical protein
MEQEHVVPKIAKMKNLHTIWQIRNLTPLGKITVYVTDKRALHWQKLVPSY